SMFYSMICPPPPISPDSRLTPRCSHRPSRVRRLPRHLLDSFSVGGRIIEGARQRVPGLRVHPWLVEPEYLDEARRDQSQPPLPSAAIPQRQRVRLVDRIVMGDDVVAIMSPPAIDKPTFARRFLNGGVAEHSIECGRLPLPDVDHGARRVVLVVIVPALD